MRPIITSRANSFVKDSIQLHDKKGRVAQGLFLAEGLRTCTTLLSSPLTLKTLIISEQFDLMQLPLVSHEKIQPVSASVFEALSTTVTPSGIMGIFHIPPPQPVIIAELSYSLVLAQLNDPGNVGTLLRTAAALGIQTLFCVEGVDPWHPKVVMGSAGTIGLLNIISTTWDSLTDFCQKERIQRVALVAHEGHSLVTFSLSKPALFVVGNEAHGLPETWAAACDVRVTIPMPGTVESLNAAVAGSVALYMQYLKTTYTISSL